MGLQGPGCSGREAKAGEQTLTLKGLGSAKRQVVACHGQAGTEAAIAIATSPQCITARSGRPAPPKRRESLQTLKLSVPIRGGLEATTGGQSQSRIGM